MYFALTLSYIDKTVLSAAKQHLRRLCGGALDQLSGDNYEVSSYFTVHANKDIVSLELNHRH